MKKLIGLLILLLIITNVFGQKKHTKNLRWGVARGQRTIYDFKDDAGRVFDDFLHDAEYIEIGNDFNTEKAKDSNYDPVKHMTSTGTRYMFVTNNKLYFVSYEHIVDSMNTYNSEIKYRKLYLYRWDGNQWNLAVDKPLRIDNFKYENWYLTCDCYFPEMYGGNELGSKDYNSGIGLSDKNYGYIKILSNGNVEINLSIFTATHMQGIDFTYYSELITLKPSGENYIIINKKTCK